MESHENKPSRSLSDEERRGTLAGLACYAFWGLCPLYWKLLDHVNPFEVIAHRIIWCWVLVVALCLFFKMTWTPMLASKRAWGHLAPAAVLITINWSLYIYAVVSGHVVDTALGYYINPLVTILLGTLFFKERLAPLQTAAVGLCLAGVGYFLVDHGELPWISLALAVSFGLYGAVKKHGCYPAVPALAMENTLTVPFAMIGALALAVFTGDHAFLDTSSAEGLTTTALLVGAGAVTAIPLVLFATAANNVPLSLMGFIQYVSPTCALILGVFVFGEPFTFAHAVCFGCIWAGLALVGIDSLRRERARRSHVQPNP